MSSGYPPPNPESGDEGSNPAGPGGRPEGEQPYGPPDDRPPYGSPGYGSAPQYGQPYGQPYGPPGYGSAPQHGQPYGQPYGSAPQYGAPPPPAPPNYLVWAIVTTLLCCLPLGIVSIVFSTQVNTKWMAGDQPGAVKASRNAKNFAIASAAAGAVVLLVGVLLAVLGAVGTSTTSGY